MASLTQAPSNSPQVQATCWRCHLPGTPESRRLALVVVGIGFLLLAGVLVASLAAGLVHPAVIVGVVVSVVIAIAMAVAAVRARLQERKLLEPENFHEVIKKNYPQVVYELYSEQRLTASELDSVMERVPFKNFGDLPQDLLRRFENFGPRKFLAGCEGITLPNLKDFLIQHCPIYFLKRFIDLGPYEVPTREGLLPEEYWLADDRLSGRQVVFSNTSWLFAQVVTREEYLDLRNDARSGNLLFFGESVAPIVARMREKARSLPSGHPAKQLGDDPALPSASMAICKHGMGWEQIQLIKHARIEHLILLDSFERLSKRGSRLANLMTYIYPSIHELGYMYDPQKAQSSLFTWEEFKRGVKEEMQGDFADYTGGVSEAAQRMMQKRLVSLSYLRNLSKN
ncbi:DUF1389 domain-containing protein [Chlamydia vaughanii]|uniref:DUF1389 domain-containing protein n=1 Tax=Chlamydia vaughanii TaxID=3112552 RepID=UPI0032B1D968